MAIPGFHFEERQQDQPGCSIERFDERAAE
jgi:hypothetical protein